MKQILQQDFLVSTLTGINKREAQTSQFKNRGLSFVDLHAWM